jgi:DHA1 family inner membrane transport protein
MALVETGMKSRESVILLTLAALNFIGCVDFMIVMPLGPQLLDELDIDARRFSWVVSAYTLAAGLAGFVAAPWLDRLPRRPAYLFAAAGLLAGTVVCGLASTFPQLLAARCVTGAFGGIQGGLALAIVADVFPLDRRGRAMGTLMVSFAVASVVGVPLGIALGTRFGWQVPFFILAVLGVPLLGLAAWSLPASSRHTDEPRRNVLAHLLELLTLPAHVRAYALIAVLMVAAFSVVPFISTALVANVGVTQDQLPILFIAGGVLTLLVTPRTESNPCLRPTRVFGWRRVLDTRTRRAVPTRQGAAMIVCATPRGGGTAPPGSVMSAGACAAAG